MTEVFLSYAVEDRAFADRLARALAAEGARTFDPLRDLPGGTDISSAILRSLRRADLVVFVVPRFEGQGKAALAELGAARAIGKRIVSVLPDTTRAANSDVATALSETHFLEERNDLSLWAAQILSELKAA